MDGASEQSFVQYSPARRVRRIIYFALGAACLAIASGLIGVSLVKSPAQVAAETAPPTPTLITAPVVHQVLSESVVMRGTLAVGRSLSFAPSSVASTAANAGGGGMVVTAVNVRSGERIRSGQVVAEVSDRPVFVLQGNLPLWRNLMPGESGKDVAELQTALADLGYSSGTDSYGFFGAGTEAAVRGFYQGIGYAPAIEPPSSVSTATVGGTRAGTRAGKTSTANPPAIVPMSEAWFVPSLPAEVLSVPAYVGEVSAASLMTIAEGSLRLTGQLDPSEESLVKVGLHVSVYSDVTGYTGTGKISSIGSQIVPSGPNGGAYVPIYIRPRTLWPTSLNGQNVQITITAVTTGRPVLAVPVAAVSYGASGLAQVTVRGPGGVERRVAVRTGVSAGGYVEITALDGGERALAAGTQVVVGQ